MAVVVAVAVAVAGGSGAKSDSSIEQNIEQSMIQSVDETINRGEENTPHALRRLFPRDTDDADDTAVRPSMMIVVMVAMMAVMMTVMRVTAGLETVRYQRGGGGGDTRPGTLQLCRSAGRLEAREDKST